MSVMPESVKKAIWEGFRNIGILNGVPATLPDTELGTAYREGTDTREPEIRCYRGKDGSEFWRHPGYGSV